MRLALPQILDQLGQLGADGFSAQVDGLEGTNSFVASAMLTSLLSSLGWGAMIGTLQGTAGASLLLGGGPNSNIGPSGGSGSNMGMTSVVPGGAAGTDGSGPIGGQDSSLTISSSITQSISTGTSLVQGISVPTHTMSPWAINANYFQDSITYPKKYGIRRCTCSCKR